MVHELVQQLYALWRAEVAEHTQTKRDLFLAKDTIRVARQEANDANVSYRTVLQNLSRCDC